jgi:uncharacterized membrane protein/protein-disulfide isomerase
VKSNRLIFWLALAGMVLAVHLWVQKARGFDQGCLGLSKPIALGAGGCHEVERLPASHLFGVSNAAWGFAFYFGIALLALAKVVAASKWSRRLHAISEVGVGLGLVYSGYLIFAMLRAGRGTCVLCLISAALVLTLAIVHVGIRLCGGFQPMAEESRGIELGFASLGAFTASGLLVVVLLFVNRLGTRPLDQGESAQEVEDLVGGALGIYIDGQKLEEMRACHPDRRAPTLDLGKFVDPSTPFIGKSDGVPVVLFSDPNCEICRKYHAEFLHAAEIYGDRARFMILPRVIWDESVIEASALKLAENSGRYFELWQALFDRPRDRNRQMTAAQIRDLFGKLGIDARNLEQRLDAARPGVLKALAEAKASGIDLVPSVYIGAQKVWGHNRGVDCLGKLIDEAATLDAEKRSRPRAPQ